MSPKEIERTRRDAMEWVDRATAFFEASGKEIALAEYMNPKGQFVEDEMYLFVIDSKGVMRAHGVNENSWGNILLTSRILRVSSLLKRLLTSPTVKAVGGLNRNGTSPLPDKVLPKVVYFDKVDDVIICSGVYKE
jgi:cytochrome c